MLSKQTLEMCMGISKLDTGVRKYFDFSAAKNTTKKSNIFFFIINIHLFTHFFHFHFQVL